MAKRLLTECAWLAFFLALTLAPTSLFLNDREVSYFWPASGIAIAAVLCRGSWWVVIPFAINTYTLNRGLHRIDASLITALGLAMETLAGAWVFKSVLHGDTRLRQRSDLLKFLLACVIFAPVLGATVGAAVWGQYGVIEWDRMHTAWLCWWYGESIGILFAAPILMAGFGPLIASVRARPTESFLLAFATCISSTAVFYASPDITPILRAPIAILPLPFLYWAATRIGTSFTALLLTAFGVILTMGTAHGYGPFSPVTSSTHLVVLWVYGQLIGMSALLSSSLLSERDEAVDALRASENRFRNLVESGPSMVYAVPHDDTARLIYIGPQSSDLLGYTPEECYAQDGILTRVIHPDDLLKIAEETRDAWQKHGPIQLEYRLVRRDGAVRWVRDEATFIPQRGEAPAMWQGVIVDITSHRQAEEEFRRTQDLLTRIWNLSLDGIFVIDAEGYIVKANPAAQRILGAPEEKLIGMRHDAAEWHAASDDGHVLAPHEYPFEVVRRTQCPVIGAIAAVRDDAGQHRVLSIDGAPLHDATGKFTGAFFLVEDITAAREAEKRLEQSEARLSAIIESATDAIVSTDENEIITLFNPAAEEVFGIKRFEAVGRSLSQFLPGLLIVGTGQESGSFATAGARQKIIAGVEARGRRANGTEFPIEGAVSKGEAGGRRIYTVTLRDISERLRAEEQRNSLEAQLRHAQRIETVGQLAGGVAHDFNNLLQVIHGFTRLASEPGVSEEQRAGYLRQVAEATDRAAALTSQLLAFARRQSLEKSDCDLNELVHDHLKMIRRIIGEHIQVDFIPGHQVGNVRIDRSQIEQVLLNLCLNARDAMPNGGKLVLELGNVVIDESYQQSHPWSRPGRFAMLTVTDTGSGMDAETKARIFEPFYTTKPKGQGTGLGLSVVLGIVQQHEGLIHVYSEPEIGTVFKIYLPIVARSASEVGAKIEVPAPRGSGTVLLAEDEPSVREIAILLLQRSGYAVIPAENGEEAVALFRKHADEIRLVILDVVMPRMGGFDAHAEMSRIRPGVPVLFCSGYSGNALNNSDLPPGTHFLHKPYSYEQLLGKINEALQAASA